MTFENRKNAAKAPRILIVDDDAGQRSLLDSFLRSQGFDTRPVASGERIYVDPMPSRRGGAGTTISINMPVTIQGNANRDDVGRTLYQAGQNIARQLAASSR